MINSRQGNPAGLLRLRPEGTWSDIITSSRMMTFALNLGGVARSNCGATGPPRRADETEALRRPEAKASRLRRATVGPTLSRVETADRTYLPARPRSELIP
jgi:hypothetical protein